MQCITQWGHHYQWGCCTSLYLTALHVLDYSLKCAFWWKSFHILVRKRKQKGLRVSDSHFHWSFSVHILAVKGLKWIRSKDARWLENVKHANISTCGLHLVVPSIFIITKEVPFCFKFELHRVQPYWFTLYQWRAEKKFACDVIDTFPRHSSVVHDVTHKTSRHKMAYSHFFFFFFLATVKVGFEQIRPEIEWKNICVSSSLFHSYQ